MDRCNKLEIYSRNRIPREKSLLSSKNKEASVLHANLIANLKNKLAGFEAENRNNYWRQRPRSMLVGRLAGSIIDSCGRNCAMPPRRRKTFVGGSGEKRTTEVAALKMRIKTARGSRGTSGGGGGGQGASRQLRREPEGLGLKIRELKYELNYQTKEFETAGKHLDEDYQKLAESTR